MNMLERKALEHDLDELVRMREVRKELDEEVKQVIEAAAARTGLSPKTIKQLAKERGWNEIEREHQRQTEEELDQARAALGMLPPDRLSEAAAPRKGAKKPAAEPAHV